MAAINEPVIWRAQRGAIPEPSGVDSLIGAHRDRCLAWRKEHPLGNYRFLTPCPRISHSFQPCEPASSY
jgi:hypothetical protein